MLPNNAASLRVAAPPSNQHAKGLPARLGRARGPLYPDSVSLIRESLNSKS